MRPMYVVRKLEGSCVCRSNRSFDVHRERVLRMG